MFSNEEVARYINQHFEPVWVSVRAVPLVTIDFGNEQVVRRTLHGNVASYVCRSNGQVTDILPGIYTPRTWMDEMNGLIRIHDRLEAACSRSGPGLFVKYHRNALQELQSPADAQSETFDAPDPAGSLLQRDTRINQTIRRQAIHQYLMEHPGIGPDQMKGWLYREVLNADLDDPWLGLGETLLGGDPFDTEPDRAESGEIGHRP